MELVDFLPKPDIEACRSLLCIQPHPDDNEVGAAATIARLASLGCKITYLTVTDGRMGTSDPTQDPEQLVRVRRKETGAAAALLGVSELIFLDFQDGSYPDEKRLCDRIVSVIRRVRPEMVMTVDPFLPYEAHPDHRKVGMAAAEACIFAQFPGFKTSDGNVPEPWQVKGIAFYGTAYPNTFVNADATWDKKMQALSLHQSQFDRMTLERFGYYFNFKAVRYAEGKPFSRAEAFKVLTTDHIHMNVDTIGL